MALARDINLAKLENIDESGKETVLGVSSTRPSLQAPLASTIVTHFSNPCTSPPDSPRRRTSARIFSQQTSDLTSPDSPLSKVSTCAAESTSHCHIIASASQQRTSPHVTYWSPPAVTMARDNSLEEKETLMSNVDSSSLGQTPQSRNSMDSVSSASTTSLVLENLNATHSFTKKPVEPFEYRDDDSDVEKPRLQSASHGSVGTAMSKHVRRIIWMVSIIAVAGWGLALVALLMSGRYKHGSTLPYDHESPVKSAGKKITLESVQQGKWTPHSASIQWIAGANGEDGLLLEINQQGKDFLVVEDVRSRKGDSNAHNSTTLMKSGWFRVSGQQVWAEWYWPSPDLKKVLLISKREKVYRHSFTGIYYIYDVETQTAEPLDPQHVDGRVQLATWAPTSDSIVFTRDNNVYLRILSSKAVRQVTSDGGPEYFYGIPDWVYEEEVFQNNIATWWARDGQYVAFMRTNETMVPEYPVEFFIARPDGTTPEPGLEKYPEEVRIKYPKAGAPNPFADMLFYDLGRNEVFEVKIEGGFADDDRLIADVMWADGGKVLVRELNRESDKVRMVLVDVINRSGKVIRTEDLEALDGGWVEPAQTARYVPADPANGRPKDGYIDMVVYDNNDHLAYYSPMDVKDPVMLTKGNWEVEQGLSAMDLKNNLIYFVAAKEHPTQRHVYSVDLSGKEIKPIVPTDKPGYYEASFSAKGGYALVRYDGPGIPTQKVISTPANTEAYEEILEENKALAKQAAEYEMPHLVYSNVTIDGFVLQVVERRPPHFDPSKKYPVLFQLYGGPGSQMVNRRFRIDFQSYIASSLGYVVVTVDGRGTGFIGRKARCIVKGNLGKYEANDQIETAKIWAKKPYVDAERMAIWGWSYGGFMTLKVLETDAGNTFKYGMAVAPVTDWRLYDSIYTERYMRTPQNNAAGYASSAITNVTALSSNVRWLMMHGVADDNVHMQNTLTLIDKLDLAGIKNYDVHFFPDSDHGIYFHGANDVVYGKLSEWLINAFNGIWYETREPVPTDGRTLV